MTDLKTRVPVDVDMVLFIEKMRRWINRIPVENIELHYRGKKIDVPDTVRDEFRFTGLNTIHFILAEFYQAEK